MDEFLWKDERKFSNFTTEAGVDDNMLTNECHFEWPVALRRHFSLAGTIKRLFMV